MHGNVSPLNSCHLSVQILTNVLRVWITATTMPTAGMMWVTSPAPVSLALLEMGGNAQVHLYVVNNHILCEHAKDLS